MMSSTIRASTAEACLQLRFREQGSIWSRKASAASRNTTAVKGDMTPTENFPTGSAVRANHSSMANRKPNADQASAMRLTARATNTMPMQNRLADGDRGWRWRKNAATDSPRNRMAVLGATGTYSRPSALMCHLLVSQERRTRMAKTPTLEKHVPATRRIHTSCEGGPFSVEPEALVARFMVSGLLSHVVHHGKKLEWRMANAKKACSATSFNIPRFTFHIQH